MLDSEAGRRNMHTPRRSENEAALLFNNLSAVFFSTRSNNEGNEARRDRNEIA
jgi:hypothetical protein